MGKDVRTLRLNLRENEPCPVCGGTDHPYRNEEQVVHSLYQNIEQEYQTASAEYQQLNNRNIALKQDLLHLSELSGEITVQLQAFLQEAEQKRPSSEEEQNPDYFEKQLHTVQGKLNLLAEKMHHTISSTRNGNSMRGRSGRFARLVRLCAKGWPVAIC